MDEKIKKYRKEYYKKNKEKRKEYVEKNKEKIKAYHKKYWAEHGEEINAKRRNRKAYKYRCEKALEYIEYNVYNGNIDPLDKDIMNIYFLLLGEDK